MPNQVAFPCHEHESPPIFKYQNGGTEGGPGTETMQKSKRTTPKIMHRAGELRKEQTPAEAKLWAYLRTLREDGIHFRRQHAIGPYIADFSPKGDGVCPARQADDRVGWKPAP